MTFVNENWFWMGVFTTVSALAAIFIKEWFSSRSQARLERLRMHESHLLSAYTALYEFISDAYGSSWPPDHARDDFIQLMKERYFKTVKPHMLLFPKDIRIILREFESQYECLRDQDLRPDVPFKDFMGKQIYERLARLEKSVEGRTDKILHKM